MMLSGVSAGVTATDSAAKRALARSPDDAATAGLRVRW